MLSPALEIKKLEFRLVFKLFPKGIDKSSLLRLSLSLTEIESQSQHPTQTQTIHEK